MFQDRSALVGVDEDTCRLVLVASSCTGFPFVLSSSTLFALLVPPLFLCPRCAGQSSGCAIQHFSDMCSFFLQNEHVMLAFGFAHQFEASAAAWDDADAISDPHFGML